jgi:hypothetical protein
LRFSLTFSGSTTSSTCGTQPMPGRTGWSGTG